MSLQQQLDEITASTATLVPPDRLAHLERIIAELQATGIESRCLPPGAPAPAFRLVSANGKQVASADLVALGSVVVKFFRGRWDPYDMTELETWETLQPALRQRRAVLVAVSPQTPRQNGFTADQHRLTFPLLSDPACALAEAFGMAYAVPPPTQAYFRSILINVPLMNGDHSWRLPLPGTFVLDRHGVVQLAQAYADHRRRPDPADTLAALDALL